MKKRFAPFLVLLEARYAPLLFAVAPQAFAVYLWLFPKPYDGWGEIFAIIGAIGFEAVYVGAIAWAEEGRAGLWTWLTAGAALVFSIAVAVYVYLPQGRWAALHAGFPIVAFCYTMQLHRMTATRRVRNVPAQRRALVRRLVTEVRRGRQAWEMAGKQLAEKGNELLSLRMTFEEESACFAAESARLSDLARMEEAKSAQAQEELRRERERATRMSAEVRTAQEEVARLRGLVEEQSATIEASDAAAGLNVRAMAQVLRDEGLSLRTIAAILGVSDKTVRNWTEAVHANGREG
jgi:DNA-binding transcriptional regulator YiaG